MTCEDEQLVSFGGEVPQHGGGRFRPAGVVIHQHVVQNERQRRAASGVGGGQRQSQGKEQLFSRASAECFDRERPTFGVIDAERVVS